MRLFALAALLFGAACASQIMEGLVGKDITEVQLQYGPPINVMDMPDGRKAFQWRVDTDMMMPTTTTYTGVTNGGVYTGNAITTGGGFFSTACFYTLFAEPNRNKSFTVVGFQRPKWDCE